MEGCRAIPGRWRIAPVFLLAGIIPQAGGALQEGPDLFDPFHFRFRVRHSGAVISEEGEGSGG
eukprot:12841328-Alexandrium_andersonii.AAC.1